MANIKDTLTEIASIGIEMARLSDRSKELRMSLLPYHGSLPKAHQSPDVAQVVIGKRLYRIQPLIKDKDNDPRGSSNNPPPKVIDVTVTFDEVYLATDDSV